MIGLIDFESMLKGLNVGGVDYIVKLVNFDELVVCIKIYVNNV